MCRRVKRLLAVAAIVLLAGCAGIGGRRTKVSAGEELPVVDASSSRAKGAAWQENDGSLFAPQAAFWSPYRDDTAHGVGDIVTVRISVNNAAEKSASTELKRDSKLNAGITSFFGLEGKLPGVGTGAPNSATTPAQLIKTESHSEFTGDGDTKRTGRIVADVSALVTHVYPNGNMMIHGSQSLLINNEVTLLTVDGIVRPSDVAVDNVVSSDRIASARIEITGRGVVSDKQRPGLLMRVFDWVWPF